MAGGPKQRGSLLRQWLPYVPPAVRLNVRISPRQCIYVFREIPNEHFYFPVQACRVGPCYGEMCSL